MINRIGILLTVSMFVFSIGACGENTPPKGSHDPVKPAAVSSSNHTAPPPPAPTTPPAAAQVSASSAVSGRVIAVALKDENTEYMFDPGDIAVSSGETVTIEMTSQSEFHSFTVDKLGIDVEVEAGETQTFTFTFDKPGTYDLICIPHETLGMVGRIIVQ